MGHPLHSPSVRRTVARLAALMVEAHFAPHLIFIIKQLVRASRKQQLQLLPIADAIAMAMLVSPGGTARGAGDSGSRGGAWGDAAASSNAPAAPLVGQRITTFGELFEGLLRGWRLLPMGLYRRLQPGVPPTPPVGEQWRRLSHTTHPCISIGTHSATRLPAPAPYP